MRALRIVAWKAPPELVEVPEPDPRPGQVVVRVAGAGACHSDLHLMYEFEADTLPWAPPFTLGHENTGWVEGLGDGVTGLEIGEPVAVYGPWGCGRCARCRVGMEDYCERALEIGVAGGGLGLDGGMAPLTDAGLTPYHAVKRSLALLGPGSTAVVIGVGGLGHLGVQILAGMTPTRIVTVDTRADGLELATRGWADVVVHARPDAPDRIRDATEGRGADVVIDMVGTDATLALATAVARPFSHITLVGIGGGSHPFGFFSVPYEAAMATTYWGTLPELMEVLDLARRGLVRAEVQRFGLEDAALVYDKLAAGEIAGRAVVTPNTL
jgi:propanol-preferring alcohol dehydrogenase